MSFIGLDYPDGRRVQDWDPGGPLWTDIGARVGTITSPVFDTAGYGFLYVFTHGQLGQYKLDAFWNKDPNTATFQGGREWTWDPGVINAAQVVYKNLARYLYFVITPNPANAANWADDTIAYLTNRPPAPFPTTDGQPLGSYAGNIPAGGAETDFYDQVPGANVQVFVEGGSQGVDVVHQYLATNFVWTTFAHYQVAANTPDNRQLLTPFMPCRVTRTNLSGAAICTGSMITMIPVSG